MFLRGGRLDDEYINEIKDTIKLTKEQIQGYKILTTYKLSKELEIYDNYDELYFPLLTKISKINYIR